MIVGKKDYTGVSETSKGVEALTSHTNQETHKNFRHPATNGMDKRLGNAITKRENVSTEAKKEPRNETSRVQKLSKLPGYDMQY